MVKKKGQEERTATFSFSEKNTNPTFVYNFILCNVAFDLELLMAVAAPFQEPTDDDWQKPSSILQMVPELQLRKHG